MRKKGFSLNVLEFMIIFGWIIFLIVGIGLVVLPHSSYKSYKIYKDGIEVNKIVCEYSNERCFRDLYFEKNKRDLTKKWLEENCEDITPCRQNVICGDCRMKDCDALICDNPIETYKCGDYIVEKR